MYRLLQLAFTKPDKILKSRGQKFFRVSHLEISFYTLGADCRLEEEFHRRECPTVSQPVGGVLKVVGGNLGIHLQASGADQVIFMIAL